MGPGLWWIIAGLSGGGGGCDPGVLGGASTGATVGRLLRGVRSQDGPGGIANPTPCLANFRAFVCLLFVFLMMLGNCFVCAGVVTDHTGDQKENTIYVCIIYIL